MKEGIHPEYFETTITCACGEVIKTRSTKKNIKVGICSKCHPFFTGKQKFLDTAGRLERFRKKYGNKVSEAKSAPEVKQTKKSEAKSAPEVKKTEKTETKNASEEKTE